ncbi:hypothetical protein GFY24_32610 [Nocardia sp. SYP-A9097]|uniref:hypothetical protein n=1 Tax=Nocardia sp. SYP-A9097 TaxID=2663237 RepID=UPI00129B57DF|nr:hypothetical protein [Nocardia sp. SYP-A9097]MRH92127.1 hypothetical protein [Nocardia sp. SYP-A9097]
MDVGDEWIYRLRDYDSSERVRILGIEQSKKKIRVEIEFVDGDKRGIRETIPGTRLRAPWAGVDGYDQRMANWRRLEEQNDLTDTEVSAISTVFDLFVPREIAYTDWRQVKNALAVRDRVKFEQIIGAPLADVLAEVAGFDLDDEALLSPAGTLRCAELVCRRNPMPILEWITQEENEKREHCKRGRKYQGRNRSDAATSDPETEYQFYLEYDRPHNELLRQWCGHRAVTLQERLAAAEAEVHRLDVLVTRLIDIVKDHNSLLAETLERTHDEERITPANVRPVVERPLNPAEIPVRYIQTPPRRWR